MNIIKGDIHTIIKTLPSDHFNLLYTDPPFAMTGAKWDKELRWDELWKDIWRVLKPNGIVVLHSTQIFTHLLVASQIKHFKYNWVWKKNIATNFFLAKKQPLRIHEDICVFYKKPGTYNPQMIGDDFHQKRNVVYGGSEKYYGERKEKENKYTNEGGHKGRFPQTLLDFPIRKAKKTDKNKASTRCDEMVDYFIKTYSNEKDNILDITCYDALSGKRAVLLNRNYTGIDINPQLNGLV